MPLFNPKTLNRYLKNDAQIPTDHFSLLENWADLIRSNQIYRLKEVALHGDFKARIVEGVLGYISASDGEEFTVATEQSILRGSVDLALGEFSPSATQILAPFELKGAKTKDLDAIMPGRAKSPVEQAWEYATQAPGVKWVIVSNYVELRLYGFGDGTEAFEKFEFAKLTDPKEYQRFMLLLSAENLLSGRTSEILAQSRKEDKDITDALYADYKVLRDSLIDAVQRAAPAIAPLDAISSAQKILDRVLFTAFAEDTGLLPDHILARAFEHADPFNPRPIWENFKGLFRSIDKGNNQLNVPPYNGGLFAPDPIVDALELPDLVCEGFKRIGEYDFASEVSVTVLGHIFEQSIADVERLQAVARGEMAAETKKTGTSGKRKRDGVVYTPDYIARFIVDQTLGTHLRELFLQSFTPFITKASSLDDYENIKWKNKLAERKAWETYRDKIKALRIVDPACGSGVFLVTAFDFMKAELTQVNDKIASLKGDHLGDLFDPDSEILTHNLFGVDVNAESVEIAKLSLWIKTAKRGKTLDSLDQNILVGDSLIEDSNFAYLSHGFRWADAFPDIFAEGGFDVVLGNPPYVRQELLSPLKPYLEKRFEVYHGVADLYCYFFERGLRLLKPGGRMGYISSSTFFKTNSGKPLREYLAQKAVLEHIVDFGDHQIFEGVTTYPAILTMVNGVPDKDHEINFWTIDELPQSNFRATYKKKAQIYPQHHLDGQSWELEDPRLKALRDKIRAGKPTLKEVYGSPLYGIKTGRNEAFVIDRATRDRLVAEDPKSAEILKPWLEGKDLKRWRAESRDLSLILFPKGWTVAQYGRLREADAWSKLQDDFSAIADHLAPYAEVCRKRTDKGDYWWELRACDYYKEFETPKVSYPHFSVQAHFQVDTCGYFSNDKTYIHTSMGAVGAALLNSKPLWFILTAFSPPVRGGFYEMRSYYMDALPIPRATDAQKQQLAALAEQCQKAAAARYELQQGLRRRIPDLCPPEREAKLNNKLKDWWTLPDFAAFRAEVKKLFKADIPLSERSDWEDWLNRDRAEIARLTADIAAAEHEINQLVYQLFELTPDEIALLEANI